MQKNLSHITFCSPVGILTIYGNNSHVFSIKWENRNTRYTTPLLCEAAKQLDAYFNKKLESFDIPIVLLGTKFQISVWKQISLIPFGKTISYKDIGTLVRSKPRAVGGACGKNPIPILVPCHRVISSTSTLTGYSAPGGIKTKLQLLSLEGSII